MTTEEAIAISKGIFQNSGYKKVQHVPLILGVGANEEKVVQANCNHLFVIELPYGCSVKSDLGKSGFELEGVTDFVEIHSGQITIINYTNQRVNVRFLQAIYSI